MTTKILLKTSNGNLIDKWVHEEHENDMLEFLKTHDNKYEICHLDFSDVKFEWFYIDLTSDDVETIKETCWYFNHIHNQPFLDNFLVEGTTIEAVIAEYIPQD